MMLLRICDQKRNFLREYVLEKMVEDRLFGNFSLDHRVVENMYQSAKQVSFEKTECVDKKIDVIEKKITDYKRKNDLLLDTYLDGRISKENFEKKELEIKNEIKLHEIELEKTKDSPSSEFTLEQTKKLFKAFVDTKNRYSDMSEEEKRKSLFKLLSNITLKDREIVDIQYQSPYEMLTKQPEFTDVLTLCE